MPNTRLAEVQLIVLPYAALRAHDTQAVAQAHGVDGTTSHRRIGLRRNHKLWNAMFCTPQSMQKVVACTAYIPDVLYNMHQMHATVTTACKQGACRGEGGGLSSVPHPQDRERPW